MAVSKNFAEDQAVRDILRGSAFPIFVGRYERSRKRLTLGTLGNENVRAIREEVTRRLRAGGVSSSVAVVRHAPSALKKARSLEALLDQTGRGTLVFDRTLALTRTEAVVALGRSLREQIGAKLTGLFFQSERRTLFVLVATDLLSDAGARERLSRGIADAETRWRKAFPDQELDLAVRVGVSVPNGIHVVAVDRLTVRTALFKLLRHERVGRWAAALLGVLAGAAVSVPAAAADLAVEPDPATKLQALSLPAVDEPNVTFSTLAGAARDPVLFDHLWAGLGVKATLPLGERFGAQLDLGVATDSYYGAGLHLFARDPAMGLVGVVGSAEVQYGVTMNRIGAELEYYLNDNFTIAARAGYQGGLAPNGVFGRLDVKFYPDPNLALSAGVEVQPSFALARGGFEWRPAADALPGMSITGDGSVTNTGNYRAMFGLHFQLGGSEKLIDRDRRSDPLTAIWNQIDTSSAAYGGGAQ